MRLTFGDVRLPGLLRNGTGAYLRITSLADGGMQRLDAISIHEWRHTSAYFNGSAVRVELLAHPRTGPARVEIKAVQQGLRQQDEGVVASICDDTDSRSHSSSAPDARVLPVGCTAFLVGETCFLTAGHCTAQQQGDVVPDLTMMQVIEFNVPLSNGDGSINFADPEDQYPVRPTSIQFQFGRCSDDWAYFGTFANSNTGMKPLQAQGQSYDLALATPIELPTIRIRGYGTTAATELPLEWNQVQKTSTGPVVQISAH